MERILRLSKEDMVPKKKIIYLRALCNKVNFTYQKASEDYKMFIQLCQPKNYELLKNLMFTYIFKKKRNLETVFESYTIQTCITLANEIA